MTDLEAAIKGRLEKAWNETLGAFGSLKEPWLAHGEKNQQRIEQFTQALIQSLINDEFLVEPGEYEPDHDYSISAMQQLHRLQGLTGDINETIKWLAVLNHVVAYGIERDTVLTLAEPAQDEWQECTFEDIQKGDRVKRVMHNSDGTTATIEGPAKYHHLTGWGTNEHYLAFEEDDPQDNITLYRIPAPANHPDPEMHAVIIVSGAYDVDWDHAYAFVSDGTGYNIVEPLNSDSRLLPEAIHNWSPAKVVEDDR